jgi:hydrogenase/urease accessory protein HupE
MAYLVFALLAAFLPAQAHETRPAYLEIRETAPNQFSILWRVPVLAGMRLPVAMKLPAGFRDLSEHKEEMLADSVIERRKVDAGPNGFAGKRIEFPGLQLTITEVIARIQRLDGIHSTEVVRPVRPWLEVSAPRGAFATAAAFFNQGVEHILLGLDHLLFVLGLLLIVRTPMMLLKTITAFTVAHSITLALATLGYASIPGPPLNAAIALSILFLGLEIIRTERGETSFTIRHPWIVAFAFGLLHGFGFASGLTAIGLPKDDIPLALLMFNLGVEAGQLAFVGLILALVQAFKLIELHWPKPVSQMPAYLVGSLGSFWTIQRVVLMFGGQW